MSSVTTRSIERRDRASIAALLLDIDEFTRDEIEVALELVDHAIEATDDYRVIVGATEGATGVAADGRVDGYLCFGPTPMTEGTFDLYWIATHPRARRSGLGRALLRALDQEIAAHSGRLVRVETSGRDAYASTRAFYASSGYAIVAQIRDFYAVGDDLVIYGRYV